MNKDSKILHRFPRLLALSSLMLLAIATFSISIQWLRQILLKKSFFSHSTNQKKQDELLIARLFEKIDQLEIKLDMQEKKADLRSSLTVKSTPTALPSDVARGNNAMTAQFTYMAIILGLILGALLFRITSLNWDTPISLRDALMALLGITTVITAIDLWIKYAWGLILYEWPLEPRHNLIYLGVGLCETGLALSINVISVWLFLAAALCVAAIIAYLYNENLAMEEMSIWAEKLKRTNAELPEAPVRTSWIKKFMWKQSFLRQSNKFELSSALAYALIMVIFGVLVLILPQIQIFAIIGVGLSLLCATYDLLTQAVIMLNQRTITGGL